MASLLNSDFKGAAKRLDKYDVPLMAVDLSVTEDELYAFMDTETRASGFDKLGRPAMLFEPHKFFIHLSGEQRAQAVAAGLAYKDWGTKPYPKDSYPRLKAAMQINETAALKSASIGASQVLGEHFKMLGYKTVQGMFQAFMDDEEAHIKGMVAYMKATGIDEDLRKLAAITDREITPQDCAPAVRKYNGKSFAKQGYHKRFAAYLNKRRKIPNTVIPVELLKPVAAPQPVAVDESERVVKDILEVDPPLDRTEIKHLQQQLAALGYPEVGSIDGMFGTKTRAALLAYQADNGLALNPSATFSVLMSVLQGRKREVSAERSYATKATIADKPAVAVTDTLQKIGTGILATSGVGAVLEGSGDLQKVVDSANKLKAIAETVMSLSPWLLTGVVGFAAVVLGRKLVAHLVNEYREGRLL